MKRIIFTLVFFSLITCLGFSQSKQSNGSFILSEKNAHQTGLIFRNPETDPQARRVLRVFPAAKAIDYSRYKATSCDNSQYLPPVDNQGAQGSCTAWAVGYYYKTYQENKEHNRTTAAELQNTDNICSPAFIYNLVHAEGDNGAYFEDAFRVLDDFGCASLTEMPYDSSDYTTWPSTDAFKNAMYKRTEAPTGYAMNYLKLVDDAALDQVKQLLLNGHLVTFGIAVYGNYDNISDYNNIYALADETGSNRGGHAQCIVGYDDTIVTPDGTGAFRVVNSWGTGWGDNGFYWISYEAIKYGTDLSGGYAYWVDDRNDYQPDSYALFSVVQRYSRQMVPEFTGSNGESFEILHFYVNQDDYDYHPFPTNAIAVDLTDIDPGTCDSVVLHMNYNSDGDLDHGDSGTINTYAVHFIASGKDYTSYDTPVSFSYSSGGQATVYFTDTVYTITASANEGGSISPDGNSLASAGADKTYTFHADDGYHIKDVKVDGSSVGVVTVYTFHNIQANHTIEVQFEVNQEFYTITATAVSEGGSIDPSGDIQVEHGTDQSFTITPDEGYFINDVQVDGQSVGRVSTYSFLNVNASHSIKAKFSTSLNPEISLAETRTISVVAPTAVEFHCEADDPDGGKILQYIWEIQGSETEKILGCAPVLNYTFRQEGVYTVKVTVVDDEGETATATLKDDRGRDAKITIIKPESVPVVIPSVVAVSQKGISFTGMDTNFINTNDTDMNLTIQYLAADGSVLSTTSKEIPAYGRLVLNGNEDIPGNCTDVITKADRCPLVYASLSMENGKMTAYLSSLYHGSLSIPHIAEESDYWDTMMFLEDLQPGTINIRVAGTDHESQLNKQGNFIDLESFLPQSGGENCGVGTVQTVSSNPFQSQTNSLNGFEMFVHNGTDGAAVELPAFGGTTLFLPHIPEETNIFWTGFALVNLDQASPATVTVSVYTKDGELKGSKSLTIPASGKIKETVEDIFPDLYGQVDWGVIQSDRDIAGIEIYGTADSAICGFGLPSVATTEGYLPEVLNGEGLWTGIGITNPGNNEAVVTIQLVNKDGDVKAEKTENIGAKCRFTAVVSQLFDSAVVEDGDYIRYSSGVPVLGLVVSGDNARTYMTALTGKK
ncbi:MAG: hypothetical protein GXO69_07690 [Acidobacteria bacterium]|nr:hypothetical protein [Acidobacteriota bacterium]